mmetsp:Transcript_26471/g.57355  ORF Transcript_26471/g.57355 Transcript_26471/m.57355 type:complete len:666 (-) Transcript_26471:65-2062(-)
MPSTAAVLLLVAATAANTSSPVTAFSLSHSPIGHRPGATAFLRAITADDDGDYNELYDNDGSSNLAGDNGSGSSDDEVDIAIVGAGIGGLCAGAILNTLYGKKVGIYESHYLPGGCAHAFDRVGKNAQTGERTVFTFDSGPTIVLGCSAKPYNPLRQVLNAIGRGDEVQWLRYDGWGMIEHPCEEKELRWKVELGPDVFEQGPLAEFGGTEAQREFRELQDITIELVSGAVAIPAMAMRAGPAALIPLLRYFKELVGLIKLGPDLTTGTFAPYMDGPRFVVKNQWLRDWLDALAFSLSGLPASRTSAAAMAYVIYDMHRSGAALDYPQGGLGSVIDSLVKGVEQGNKGSKVNLRSHVDSIDTSDDGTRFVGLTLKNGKTVKAKEGVICNAPVWSIVDLISNPETKRALNDMMVPREVENRQSWIIPEDPDKRSVIQTVRPKPRTSEEGGGLLSKCNDSEMTGSFLHLHLALDATGLDLDTMEAHYTVMARGLGGDEDDDTDTACGELNMIALSNPCVLDRTLAPDGHIVVHAYGAGNEPYDIWKGLDRKSDEYKRLKEERSQVLWRAVESVIPDARQRVVLDMVGSPLTHERFLRRPKGTYGAATEDYLKDGSTPFDSLVFCGDGIFPGIGVPAVALSGASAANAMVNPLKQWFCLDNLKQKNLI